MLKLIYYPNKFEIYTSSLRLVYQKLILKNGIKQKYLKSLRKIDEFEGVIFQNEPIPINVEDFCGELLTAVFLKKDFDYNINVSGNYILDKKIFTMLILSICVKTDFLTIFNFNQNIVLKGKFKCSSKILRLTEKLGGNVFSEVKTGTTFIRFDFPLTQKNTEDFEKAYYLLQNPLSKVNLYLNGQ